MSSKAVVQERIRDATHALSLSKRGSAWLRFMDEDTAAIARGKSSAAQYVRVAARQMVGDRKEG